MNGYRDIAIAEALEGLKAGKLCAIDLRTPHEFVAGHIPGAISLPLFNDKEHARIGTVYKCQGKQGAVDLGLRLIGRRLADIVKQIRDIGREATPLLYCWRGGMRSRSAAHLIAAAGEDCCRLIDGYKAFRTHFSTYLVEHPLQLIVLGGETGSGKTRILASLNLLGEQCLDLEGLANHRGSAFGALGLPPQPNTEQFINLLHMAIYALDPARRVWVESESATIGHVFIPSLFLEQMRRSPLLQIAVPIKRRALCIAEVYGGFAPEDLLPAFEAIHRRLGDLAFTQARDALVCGNISAAIEIALHYYDKAYRRSLGENWGEPHWRIDVDPAANDITIARNLLELVGNYCNP